MRFFAMLGIFLVLSALRALLQSLLGVSVSGKPFSVVAYDVITLICGMVILEAGKRLGVFLS